MLRREYFYYLSAPIRLPHPIPWSVVQKCYRGTLLRERNTPPVCLPHPLFWSGVGPVIPLSDNLLSRSFALGNKVNWIPFFRYYDRKWNLSIKNLFTGKTRHQLGCSRISQIWTKPSLTDILNNFCFDKKAEKLKNIIAPPLLHPWTWVAGQPKIDNPKNIGKLTHCN